MESVSLMKSLGAMNFYEDDCGVPAYMAVRNSVTKSELGKEHLELESNQLEDHINDIHDCQQDPDNFEVNVVCIGQEEEEEEDEGNACKVDEGGTTVCGIADVRNDEDGEITAKTGVHVQTQQTSVDVKCAKQDGGNSSKSMTKIWSDIPSNEDRDGIAKIEGVPEQAQGTTGPVCNDIPQKQQDAHLNNLTSSNNARNRNESVVNAKQAGEEVEKGGGNTPKMEEDLKTRTECEDSDDVNTPKVNGATENSKEERQDGVNTSDVNAKQAGEEVEKGGGIALKMEEDFKTSTDAVNTPEMDSTTENRKEEGQNGGNIPTVNAKQAGEEVEKGRGNTPKMEEDFKTRTECEDSDDVNTPKVNGATENSKEESQDEMNSSDVNAKQAGEEVEKGGGIALKVEEDFNTSTEYDNKDAVNTPEIDSTTEDSKEEGQNGGNIPTDHYGECDSEQDAKNSPSCLKGTKNWRCSQRFYQKLLLGFFVLLAFAIHETNALPTKQSEYAADFRNTQKYLLCDYYSTPFFNTTSKTHCKSRCYNEAKENNCQPGFQGFCLPWVGKGVIAGCINTTGLQLDGEKCLQVTYVVEHNKYKADCHDKKCPNCINANSLEERLKMCLFQNETSGDSQSIECSPENGSTRSGCVQPTCWIPGLAVVLLLVHVLTSH